MLYQLAMLRVLAVSCLAPRYLNRTAEDRVGQSIGSKLADSPLRDREGVL